MKSWSMSLDPGEPGCVARGRDEGPLLTFAGSSLP